MCEFLPGRVFENRKMKTLTTTLRLAILSALSLTCADVGPLMGKVVTYATHPSFEVTENAPALLVQPEARSTLLMERIDMRIVPEERRAVNPGDEFGRLKAVGVPFYVQFRVGDRHREQWAVCECLCGAFVPVRCSLLVKGLTSSCGCLFRDEARERLLGCKGGYKHGGNGTRLYGILRSMRGRCNDCNHKAYQNYGGRGICICDEWSDFAVFRDWALANGYRDGLTIDRIENNGNYEPGNCRWATRTEQLNNKRNNRPILAFGETKNISQWVVDPRCKVRFGCLRQRIERGIHAEIAITTPSKKASRKPRGIVRDLL